MQTIWSYVEFLRINNETAMEWKKWIDEQSKKYNDKIIAKLVEIINKISIVPFKNLNMLNKVIAIETKLTDQNYDYNYKKKKEITIDLTNKQEANPEVKQVPSPEVKQVANPEVKQVASPEVKHEIIKEIKIEDMKLDETKPKEKKERAKKEPTAKKESKAKKEPKEPKAPKAKKESKAKKDNNINTTDINISKSTVEATKQSKYKKLSIPIILESESESESDSESE
jgi:hypothetical protein